MKMLIPIVVFLLSLTACEGPEQEGSEYSAVSTSTSQQGKVSFYFKITDEVGERLDDAEITLLGGTVITQAQANDMVELKVIHAHTYQFVVSADGHYSMIHSFSETERQKLNGKLPVIQLVQKKANRVMLAFTGDVMLGRRYHKPNPGEPRYLNSDTILEDTETLLKPIKPYLQLADYVSVNLESPILKSEPERRAPKGIVFFSQPETLEALSWAGVDHVSLGNNHSADYLDTGLKQTLAYLSNSGLDYSGAGMTESQALEASKTTINEVPYSFLGYVGWPGRVTPSQVAEGDHKAGAALGTVENITRSVANQPGQSTSVVEYHGSREYSEGPTDQTVTRLRAAIDAGADIAIGHHPHVLHGFDFHKGKLLAYSLGNFLFDQYIYETQRSALLYVWMDGDEFYRAEVVPLYIKAYRPTPAVNGVRDYVFRRMMHQSSKDVMFATSGAHLLVDEGSITKSPNGSLTIAPGKVVQPLNWNSQLVEIATTEPGVTYRIGEELWPLGDFESATTFGLQTYNWYFSDPDSAIHIQDGIDNNAMFLHKKANQSRTSVGQKYFLRVWDQHPKSVVLDVKSPSNALVTLCLEKRNAEMSISEGRASPEVECLEAKKVPSGSWEQLVFDFDPPPEAYRGLRFKFYFDSNSEDQELILVDNLKFVSWKEQGVLDSNLEFDISQPNRYSLVQFSASESVDCCTLKFSYF